MTRPIPFAMSVILLVAVPCRALGSDGAIEKASAENPSVEVIAVTIHPAAAPTPALQNQLLTTLLESKPGNAVGYYAKAFIFREESHRAVQHKDEMYLNNVVKWLETPLDAIPRDRAHEIVDAFRGTLDQVELAVLRERCDWDLPLHEGNVFNILLPECQSIRDLGRLLALRARLQMADGKYAEAVCSLRTGFAMARQIAEQPIFVSQLVGISIARMMDAQLLTMSQMPDAPNLYWALAALPNPLINLRKGLLFERDGMYLQFPDLQNAGRAERSPGEWDRLLQRIVVQMQEIRSPGDRSSVTTAPILAEVPAARAELAKAGYSENELNKMPPAQIALLSMLRTYNVLRDELFKRCALPYWQAKDGYIEVEKEIAAARKRSPLACLVSVLPSLGTGIFSGVRLEREIAALRCIEALRLYAAGHDGKLPTTLDDIKEVPIPLNPVTGKAFGYRLEGSTAVFDADGGPAGTPWPRYRITMAK